MTREAIRTEHLDRIYKLKPSHKQKQEARKEGRAWVDGLDVETGAAEIRRRINRIAGGETSDYGLLTVRENLWMFSQFYGLDYTPTNQRIDELLDLVGMSERKSTKISDLSTGLRQKMNCKHSPLPWGHVVSALAGAGGHVFGAFGRGKVRQWKLVATDSSGFSGIAFPPHLCPPQRGRG